MAFFVYFDDDPFSLEIMNVILARIMQAEVALFRDSVDYIQRTEALPNRPDAILLDIQMQPHSGFEVLNGFRAHPVFSRTPIVALTASVMNEDIQMLQQAGFDSVIGKPVDQDTLPELLYRIISGERVWRVM
jgi:CheY-like chemotaxis protein